MKAMPERDWTKRYSPETLKAFDEIRRALHADVIIISRPNPVEEMTAEEVDQYVERTVGEMGRKRMAERSCPRHGDHEQRSKCPACAWVEKYPGKAHFVMGCPRCGGELAGNGFIMWCENDQCSMQTTSHQPV